MKMKKLIPVITAVCAVAAFGGCKTRHTKEYEELNAKLDLSYSRIVLTVTESFEEDLTLVSEYAMSFTDEGMTVDYSVERFAQASLDSEASEKTTLAGEAKIAGGKVSYVSGDEVTLDSLVTGSGLSFKEEYFKNADLTGVYLKADVKNASAFLGTQIQCSDMKVFATFLDYFMKIQVSFKAEDGSLVEYRYDFNR